MYDKVAEQAELFFKITLGFKERDLIPGGVADQKSIKDFDPKALEEGKKVEMEHTNNPNIAEEIAADHLEELDDYYERLQAIEGH